MGRCYRICRPRQQGRLRNLHLGFVYRFHHLLPEFSALDDVAMPLRVRRLPYARCKQQAAEMLAHVGLEGARAAPPGRALGR